MNQDKVKDLVKTLLTEIGEDTKREGLLMEIRLVKPYVGREELENLKGVIDRAWLGRGPLCKEFEDKWSAFLGVKASAAVNSGTAGRKMEKQV